LNSICRFIRLLNKYTEKEKQVFEKSFTEMKRTIGFVSLKDQEEQQLEDFARLTFQERFDYLAFLQKSFLHLKQGNIHIDDIGRKFIVLSKKENGYK
jgi:hypothetical protein